MSGKDIHIADLHQLSAIVGMRGVYMMHIGIHMQKYVNKHVITTNHGQKQRTIYAPDHRVTWLQNSIRQNLLIPMSDHHDACHGFVPGRSSLTNAKQHVNKAVVVNIDLKNFFPSVSPDRVYGYWLRRTALPGEVVTEKSPRSRVAWLLTRLTTYDDHLCQGFSTSPDIANHLCWMLDRRLASLAACRGWTFTRYADDLTFSSNEPGPVDWLVKAVTEIVADEGFTVNEKKIAIMRAGRRQTVTGLVVNGNSGTEERCSDPRIPRWCRRRIRAMAHQAADLSPGQRSFVSGWLSYIHSVQPNVAAAIKESSWIG